MLKLAAGYVSVIPEDLRGKVRCHELARAVGNLLKLPVQDGRYKLIEHSWIWTSNPSPFVKIIDVYTPGCLPQVQLIDYISHATPHYDSYRPGDERTDIDHIMVNKLMSAMERSGIVLHEIR